MIEVYDGVPFEKPKYRINHIGIDPGKSGAISVMDTYGNVIVSPFDEKRYLEIVGHLCSGIPETIAVVEDVHAMPKQGVTSMFNFGYNKGWIVGLLKAYGCQVWLVSPQKWKKYFCLDGDKKKSIDLAHKLFPSVNLFATPRCRKEHDGIAESLLMMEFGRREMDRIVSECKTSISHT